MTTLNYTLSQKKYLYTNWQSDHSSRAQVLHPPNRRPFRVSAFKPHLRGRCTAVHALGTSADITLIVLLKQPPRCCNSICKHSCYQGQSGAPLRSEHMTCSPMLPAVVSGSSRPVPAQLQHCVAARHPRRRWECRCTAPKAQAPLVNRGVERRVALLGALAGVLGLQYPCAAQAAVPEAVQDGFRAPLPNISSSNNY